MTATAEPSPQPTIPERAAPGQEGHEADDAVLMLWANSAHRDSLRRRPELVRDGTAR
jgi:hypothetical protein